MSKKKKITLIIVIAIAAIIIIASVAVLYWKSSAEQRQDLVDNFKEYYDETEEAVSTFESESETEVTGDYQNIDVVSLTTDMLKGTPYERYEVVLMDETYLDNGDRVCHVRIGTSTFLYTFTVHPDCTYEVVFTPSAFNADSPGIDYFIIPPNLEESLQIDNLAATLDTDNILRVVSCWGNYAELEDTVNGNRYVVNFSENTIQEGYRPDAVIDKAAYYGETTSETCNPEDDDYEGEPVSAGTAYVVNYDELCADLDSESDLAQVNSIVQSSVDILNSDADIAYTYSVDERGHIIFDSAVLQLDVYPDTSCDSWAFTFTIK